MKIHLLGPSGSGTSTLGKLIAEKYGYVWFDSDDFFWVRTDPPFKQKREKAERTCLLLETLANHESWVLSGSVLEWGDGIKRILDLVIYKYVEPNVRLERLTQREHERFGSRIEAGNDMHENHLEFLQWAASYENGGMNMRSRMSETAWMKDLKCPILLIERDLPVFEELKLASAEIEKIQKPLA